MSLERKDIRYSWWFILVISSVPNEIQLLTRDVRGHSPSNAEWSQALFFSCSVCIEWNIYTLQTTVKGNERVSSWCKLKKQQPICLPAAVVKPVMLDFGRIKREGDAIRRKKEQKRERWRHKILRKTLGWKRGRRDKNGGKNKRGR